MKKRKFSLRLFSFTTRLFPPFAFTILVGCWNHTEDATLSCVVYKRNVDSLCFSSPAHDGKAFGVEYASFQDNKARIKFREAFKALRTFEDFKLLKMPESSVRFYI